MGADMIIATAEDRHHRTREELEELINNLTPEEASRIFEDANQANYGELYESDDESELEHIKNQLRTALEGVRGARRDIAPIDVGDDRIIWITGGMTWGDDPTDMFMPLCYLELTGFF